MAQSTALLLIDMINEFAHPEGKLFVPGAPETVPRLAAVLAACRRAGLPVFYIAREHRADGRDVESVRRDVFRRLGGFCLVGSWGSAILVELAPLPGETIVVKHGWSAFFQTDLHHLLEHLGIERVVVGGTQTANCVRATIYDATALGYDVLLLGDGTSSAAPDMQEANLRDLVAMGVPMIDCAGLVAELQETAPPYARPQAVLRRPRPGERAIFTQIALETIRQGDLRLDALLRLPLLSWCSRWILHLLFHSLSQAFFLEVDTERAGILVLRRAGEALYIEALGLLPDFRQRGWGRWLLRQAEEKARQKKLRRLVLQVSTGNRPALDLYWKEGFRPIPRRWVDIWMERPLSEERQ